MNIIDKSVTLDNEVRGKSEFETKMIKMLTRHFPHEFSLINESDQHKGHNTTHKTNSHFRVTIISKDFDKMTKIERHRRVYQILDQSFKEGLHALSIIALTPEEAKILPNK